MIGYLGTDADSLSRAFAAAGYAVRVVPAALGKAAVLAAFADALEFPSYFGGNLDALAECAADLSWLPRPLVILWAGAGELEQSDPALAAAIATILAAQLPTDVVVVACQR